MATAQEGFVVVADEQSDETVDIDRWSTLATAVLEAEGVEPGAELCLVFVDELAMADLNRQFMGEDRPTDVLAFPIDEVTTSSRHDPTPSAAAGSASNQVGPIMLGDVVICPAVARRNAPAHAGTYDDELALLVVHGILHVLGMDHAEEAERIDMQARERAHLASFHRK